MNGTRRGLFITLDGPGGVGKSTTAGQVCDLLAERGYLVHATAEPSRAQLGQIARASTDTYEGHTLACLVAADRYHHLAAEIRPALAAGRIVVCDRYIPSSYVLQSMDGVPLEFIENLNAAADIPDLAVILTADPAVATARIEKRGVRHRFETGLVASRLEADLYRHTARRLAEKQFRVLTVDTTHSPPAAVARQIVDDITQLAGLPHSREPGT